MSFHVLVPGRIGFPGLCSLKIDERSTTHDGCRSSVAVVEVEFRAVASRLRCLMCCKFGHASQRAGCQSVAAFTKILVVKKAAVDLQHERIVTEFSNVVNGPDVFRL